jgi:hypothetical protein
MGGSRPICENSSINFFSGSIEKVDPVLKNFVHGPTFIEDLRKRFIGFKIDKKNLSGKITKNRKTKTDIQKCFNLKANRMAFIQDLWLFLKVRKKWWLAPIIILMLLFGTLIILTKGSALAPFIYTLF